MLVAVDPIPRFSFSQVNTWLACEQKWWWNYHYELVPATDAAYFQVGTLLHEMLDTYYTGILNGDYSPGSWYIWDTLVPRIAAELEGKITVNDAVLYGLCLQVMKKYVNEWSPVIDDKITVINSEFIVEQRITTPHGRIFLFEGYVDLLYQQFGKIYLMDHKSSGQATFWRDSQYETYIQLSLYAAILALMGIHSDFQVVNHLNTYDYKDYWAQPLEKLFKRKVLTRSSNEQGSVLGNFVASVERIMDASANPEFVPVKNLSPDCSHCPYQSLCVYEMKGIPTHGLINTKFTTKSARAAKTDSR